jgi:glycosyltransferase involved in cell wall biosynthesis
MIKLYNIIVSNTLNYWYRCTEPLKLWVSRTLYSNCNDDDLVSIIIPTYNRSGILINRTLPSILAQTHKNIEIVIIGDCCIDDTVNKMSIIDDQRIKFHDLEKRGKYPQDIEDRWFVQGTTPRNYGMQVAKGRWFVFISDDDVLYPNHIKILLKKAKEKNLEFISGAYETIKDGKTIEVQPSKWNNNSELICGGMQTWLYRSYLRCFKWNRHSWRKKYDRPCDYDLQQRFYQSGVRMGHINEVVYFNPPVEGTNTTGYKAAIMVENNVK